MTIDKPDIENDYAHGDHFVVDVPVVDVPSDPGLNTDVARGDAQVLDQIQQDMSDIAHILAQIEPGSGDVSTPDIAPENTKPEKSISDTFSFVATGDETVDTPTAFAGGEAINMSEVLSAPDEIDVLDSLSHLHPVHDPNSSLSAPLENLGDLRASSSDLGHDALSRDLSDFLYDTSIVF